MNKIPLPICKRCGKTIDVKKGIKEIETPSGEHEFYHPDCKSEWEKGKEFFLKKGGSCEIRL